MPHSDRNNKDKEKTEQPGPAEAEAGAPAESEKLSREPEALLKQLEEEKAKAEDYLKHWQRTQADFINYKRRTEQERVDLGKYANASLILKILPVLDDFDRAFASIPQEFRQATWLEGITLIDRKLRLTLEQEGVVAIDAVGKGFDPQLHEAVLFEEGVDLEHGKVVAELQKGYKLHDRVIRPTLVKVGQMPAEAPENQ